MFSNFSETRHSSTLRCRERQICYIFILDERPVDSTTFYAYREFFQKIVESDYKKFRLNPYTILTYLSFEGGSFNLIVSGLEIGRFTRDLWYQRAKSEQEVVISIDNAMCIFCDIQVFLLVAQPIEVRPFLAKLFICDGTYTFYSYKYAVFEIFVSDQQTLQDSWNYPLCVLEGKKHFKTIQDLQLGSLDDLHFSESIYGRRDEIRNKCGGGMQFEFIVYRNDMQFISSAFCSNKDHKHNLALIVYEEYLVTLPIFEGNDICVMEQMSPLIIRNERELPKIADAIKDGFSTFFRHMMTYNLSIGLFQTKQDVGLRYSWGSERDLLFSHWAPGEPRDIATKKCVSWEFAYLQNGNIVDKKWHSSRCDSYNISPVLCHQNLPARNKTLNYSPYFAINSKDIMPRGNLGQVIIQDSTKRRGFVSMSVTVASGYLHRPWGDLHRLKIVGLVANDSLVLKSRSDHQDLLEQLSILFHRCEVGQDQQTWGVPLSMVCDGKTDCQSGSDEMTCEYSGERVCSGDKYQCKSGQCVSLEARCDLLVDCQDRSDEDGCEQECQHQECSSGQCLPRSWFHDGMMDCNDGSDEIGNPPIEDTCIFTCNRIRCVTKEMLNDSVVDCTGPEGPLDETLGALEPFTCTSQDSSSTYLDKWAPKCVLARDLHGQIIGCRDFQHLSNCEHFTCPTGYVKCPNSFCIPLVNVKDGKEECDEGEDEGTNPLPDLVNFFQCNPWKPQAVPLSSVCDGRRDCPLGEDELDCGHHCPRGLLCLAGAVSAVRYDKKKPLRNLSFINPDTRYLDLSGVSGIYDFFNIYPTHRLRYLRALILSKCKIQTVFKSSQIGAISTTGRHKGSWGSGKHFRDFQMVKTIDLSHNNLTKLPPSSYLNLMPSLEKLNLSSNVFLAVLCRESFTNLKMLKILDLSFTGLTQLDPDVWDQLDSLEILSLKGTGIVSITSTLPETIEYFNIELTTAPDVSVNVFSKVRDMKKLRSSNYKLCCPGVLGYNIPTHVCTFTGCPLSLCQNLIREPFLRVVVWLVGLSTLAGNTVTLVYRFTWDRDVLKKPYGLFVTNLGVSDFFMGVYLVVIAIADRMFYGEYVLHDCKWRHSQTCKAASILVTMSSLTSIVFISLITVERYLAVRYPYGQVRLNHRTVQAAVLSAWMFGLTAAFLPLMPFVKHWTIISTTGMCVALPLSTNSLPGQWYSAMLFVGVDLILFIFIGVGQAVIYRTLKDQGMRTRKHCSKHSQLRQNQKLQEFAIAKQLSLVVMTDCMCWLPIITMGLMTLSGFDLGEAAYRWSALLVLPIDSALNPLLYTVPEIRKRWEANKEARRQAKMLVLAVRRRRRFRLRSVAKKQSRRQLVRKSCRSLIKIRQGLLAKPHQVQETRECLGILYTKVIMLKLAVCNKQRKAVGKLLTPKQQITCF